MDTTTHPTADELAEISHRAHCHDCARLTERADRLEAEMAELARRIEDMFVIEDMIERASGRADRLEAEMAELARRIEDMFVIEDMIERASGRAARLEATVADMRAAESILARASGRRHLRPVR